MENRIPENELILPSLFLMTLNNGHIMTEELIPQLHEIMKPTGEDLEILAGRSDNKFSQKVRNLKAHNTFERLGYAEYNDGVFYITETGNNYLMQNYDILNYLLINDFTYPDLVYSLNIIGDDSHREIQVFDENLIIQEGLKKFVQKEIYTRSKILRSYALETYSGNGKLNCSCCGFSFSDFYGTEIGNNFIEMHHIKPIFQYKGDDITQTVKNAIANIIPLCSNCHRMIHKHGREPLQIQLLFEFVKNNGVFNIRK
jgi:predicted HNH restriction endonuclease